MITHSFLQEVDLLVKKGKIPPFVGEILRKFYHTYIPAITQNNYKVEQVEPMLLQLLQFAVKQISHPYRFDPYHKRIVAPFDHYQFGLDFIRPLIDIKNSKVTGLNVLEDIEKKLSQGENVIFFANHQIEPDPQVISILLEPHFPKLAQEIIMVAGHRVVTDPLAVPFSLGRNLICIYSKRHLEHPPEQKAEKMMHNQKTMKKLVQLLEEGGKCIYVAPSGGRDRPDEKGNIFPAKFDPQSVEMFILMAKQAKTPTHFYPMTLSTYRILPPPNTVEKELGEKRQAHLAPVFLDVGEEVEIESCVKGEKDKKIQRELRANYFWEKVKNRYANF